MDKEMTTITKEEYDELVDAAMLLDALEFAGVNNWQGYNDALDIYRGFKKEINL